MTSYWKNYWDKHIDTVSSDDPFRQVLRTLDKEPLSEELFDRLVAHISGQMDLDPGYTLLDISCGNGMITAELAKQVKTAVGVDFSEKMIEDIALRGADNLIGISSDVMAVNFTPETFDRALFAAAIQHFSQAQIVGIFKNVFRWLKPGGRFVITDVIDSERIWNFYDSDTREDAYFENVMKETPILGTWVDGEWLAKLARYSGFSSSERIDQPEGFPYSHYRFDFVCRK